MEYGDNGGSDPNPFGVCVSICNVLRSNILIWYLLFDIGLPIALAFDLWSATVRPKPVE